MPEQFKMLYIDLEVFLKKTSAVFHNKTEAALKIRVLKKLVSILNLILKKRYFRIFTMKKKLSYVN